MRKLLALVIFVGVVAVGANVLLKGGLPTLKGLSAEQQQLADLESDLRSVEKDWQAAERSAGIGGLDTTADATAAIADLDRIERRLTKIERSLDSDVAKEAARKLHDRIDDLRSEMR
jgi:phage shock protein A